MVNWKGRESQGLVFEEEICDGIFERIYVNTLKDKEALSASKSLQGNLIFMLSFDFTDHLTKY